MDIQRRDENADIAEAFNELVHLCAQHGRVVAESGESRSQLYACQAGTSPVTVRMLRRAYTAVRGAGHDRQRALELLARVLGLEDLGVVLVEVPEGRTADDVRQAALEVAAESGRVAAAVAEALADDVATPPEHRKIDAEIDRDHQRLETLRLTLDEATRGGGGAPKPCLRAGNRAVGAEVLAAAK